MRHLPINHSDVPIRLFKSDFLEFFTHVSPVVVVVIWLPVVGVFLTQAVLASRQALSVAHLPLGFALGLVLWTLAEYLLHRFVFHFRPRTPWQERLTFLFHGVHHAQPQLKTRLVMPPAVSIPLALIFYGLFWLVVGELLAAPQWVAPLAAGFTCGYLIYDLTHYATHHFPMKWGYLKFLRRYHMLHHFKTPEARYGVTSPLWDWVFGTQGQN